MNIFDLVCVFAFFHEVLDLGNLERNFEYPWGYPGWPVQFSLSLLISSFLSHTSWQAAGDSEQLLRSGRWREDRPKDHHGRANAASIFGGLGGGGGEPWRETIWLHANYPEMCHKHFPSLYSKVVPSPFCRNAINEFLFEEIGNVKILFFSFSF